jgi:hypothetical protein
MGFLQKGLIVEEDDFRRVNAVVDVGLILESHQPIQFLG